MLQYDTPLNHLLKHQANFLKILVLRALQEALHGHCRLMNLSQKKQPPRQCLQLEFQSQFGAGGVDLKACLHLLSFIWMAIDLTIHQYIYCIKFTLSHYDREPSWVIPIWKHQLNYLLIRCRHSFQILAQVLNSIFMLITLNSLENLFN